jgi:heme O synthase-like polyprenyltransferase
MAAKQSREPTVKQVLSHSMSSQQDAARQFRRMMKWIVLIAILMVAGALAFEASQGPLYPHMVVATVLGVFISMVVGCGLFALAFFSDKSGHDDVVRGATTEGPPEDDEDDRA